jgi:hypothetical protein
MKVVVLYRPKSEHERSVLDYERDFNQQTSKTLELISLDTVEGAEMAKLYDIVQYPAVLARDNEGKLLKVWQGDSLPLINEVSYYSQEKAH